jgi:hypothetical protein
VLPSWAFMWVLAFTIYFSLKWLTWWRARTRIAHPAWRSGAYLLAWPGMDAEAFLTRIGAYPRRYHAQGQYRKRKPTDPRRALHSLSRFDLFSFSQKFQSETRRSVSSGYTYLVNRWKLLVICADEAANQFSARKVTETEKPDAFVRSATLP